MNDRHEFEREDDTSRCVVCHRDRGDLQHLTEEEMEYLSTSDPEHSWPALLTVDARCEKCGLMYAEWAADDAGCPA